MQEKSKFEIAGYLLIALGILDFLLSWVGVNFTGVEGGPVILGAIGGFLLYLQNAQDKVADFDGSLDEGEILLKSASVSVKRSMWDSKPENGSFILTNRRLLYSGTGGERDVGSHDFELLLGEISSVETKFPTFIIIRDKNANENKLIAFGKNKWKDEILKAVFEAG